MRRSRPIIMRKVVGHSMVPALPPGTVVFAHTLIKKIKPGDVVILSHDGKEKIKRVSEFENGKIFVLGDHPETSTDSRQFGWLEVTAIKAKVIWPKHKNLDRPPIIVD